MTANAQEAQEDGLSPNMRRMIDVFSRAIARRVAFPEWLSKGLDDAKRGAPLPPLKVLCEFFDQREIYPNSTVDFGDFDGTLDGEEVDFAETLPWCTAKALYAWGIPAEESISTILPYIEEGNGLLEIGAGSGYWAAVLASRTTKKIVACDVRSSGESEWRTQPHFDIIERDGRELAKEIPDVPILMVWPDSDKAAGEIAKSMQPGRILIVAGPAHVTADDRFWSLLDTDFDRLETGQLASSTGGRADPIHVLRRRSKPVENPVSVFSMERDGRRWPWAKN